MAKKASKKVKEEVASKLLEPLRNKMRLEWRDPRTMEPYELNPKRHPTTQRVAFDEFLSESGWVDALLYNEVTGHLLDGNMRQDEAIERNLPAVPVLVINVPEEKEPEIVALKDTIGRMYRLDGVKFREIKRLQQAKSEVLRNVLSRVRPSGEVADFQMTGDIETTDEGKKRAQISLPVGGLALILGQQYNYIVLLFDRAFDFTVACDHFGVKRQKCAFKTKEVGVGRVINGREYLRGLIGEEET